ncbi:MAG: DUF4397 domain-containing protein [Pseudomonadota bacterium]|jgi:hypothetical protein
MSILRRCLVALTTALVIAPSAHGATVNVVHGINGLDLGLTRELPVDIAVNGTCSLKGVTFGQSTAVELAPANYSITVHLADGKCSQAAVITQRVTIADDASRSFSAVASLSQSGTPQLVVFNNSRELFLPSAVTVRHLAKAGPVFVTYRSREILKPQVNRIRNGKVATLSVLTDRLPFSATISAKPRGAQIARVSGVGAKKFTIYNIVGSAGNGFRIISERLAP